MKRQAYTISDLTGEEGTKRLAHYNEWLRDPNRELGKPYPGYKKSTNHPITDKQTKKRKPK